MEKTEWLAWRSKGIGSSDMPVIMGVSPWNNIYNLWLEKTGQKEAFQGNWATKRGQDLEPIVRAMYEDKRMNRFPAENMEMPKCPQFRCSFDGINYNLKEVIEIKCPSAESHAKAKAGEIPAVYIPQVQWQLMVCGFNKLTYISFHNEEIVTVEVKPDLDYQIKLAQAAADFWKHVLDNTPPCEAPKAKTSSTLDVASLLDQREKLKIDIDALTSAYDSITDTLKERVTTDQATCGEWLMSWTEVKGTVDYSKIPVLKGYDVEPYRKPATRRFNVKRCPL